MDESIYGNLTNQNYIETPLDLQKWLNDPEAKNQFKKIIKDIPLGNFTQDDIEMIEDCFDLALQLEMLQKSSKNVKFIKSIQLLYYLAYLRINDTVGRGGFGRKNFNTRFFNQKQTLEDKTEKRGFSWNFKSRKR